MKAIQVKLRSIIYILLICTIQFEIGQTQHIVTKHYSSAEGFPFSSISSIGSNVNGKLLIATKTNGIIAYDGESFTSASFQRQQLLNHIDNIYPGTHQLWISGPEKIYRISEDDSTIQYPFDIKINSFYQEEPSSCLIGTNKGLYLFSRDTIQRSKNQILQNLPIRSIINHEGKILLGTNRGIISYDKGIARHISHQEIAITKMIALSQQDAIILDNHGKISHLQKSNLMMTPIPVLASKKITKLHSINEDQVIVQSQDDHTFLIQYDIQNAKFIVSQIDLTEEFSKAHTDIFGNVWFAGRQGRLGKVFCSHSYLPSWHKDGVGVDIFKLIKDNENRIWILDNQSGVNSIDKGRILSYDASSGLGNSRCIDIAIGKDNRIWFLTSRHGLYYFDGQIVSKFHLPRQYSTAIVTALNCDIEGNIYLLTENFGLLYYEREQKQFKQLFSSQQQTNSKISITHLYADTEKPRMWYWGFDGFGIIEEGKIVSQKNDFWQDPSILTISQHQGSYLVLSKKHGIFSLSEKGKSWQKKSLKSPSFSDEIFDFKIFDNNQLFLISPTKVYKCTLDNNEIDVVTTIEHSSVFASGTFSQNAMVNTNNDNFLIGGSAGIMEIDFSNKISVYPPQLLRLDSIKINKQRFDFALDPNLPSQKLSFASNTKSIEMSFNSFHFQDDQEIQYYYKLLPDQANWTAFQDNHHLNFYNLAQGDYALSVIACLAENCSESFDVFLEIQAPFWNQNKIILGIALSILLIFGLILWGQSRIYHRKAMTLREKLNAERQRLHLEQQTLQMQMNPHFLFNALNVIKADIHPDKLDSARYNLSKFAKMVRLVLENARHEFICLADELKLISDYMDIHNMTLKDQFSYEIIVDQSIDADRILIPPMLLQPFIENAILHGIKNNVNGKIEVQFIPKGKLIEVSITDNGIGIQSDRTNKGHQSIAINLTEKRLKILNEGIRISKPIKIESNPQVNGTKITLFIPRKESLQTFV